MITQPARQQFVYAYDSLVNLEHTRFVIQRVSWQKEGRAPILSAVFTVKGTLGRCEAVIPRAWESLETIGSLFKRAQADRIRHSICRTPSHFSLKYAILNITEAEDQLIFCRPPTHLVLTTIEDSSMAETADLSDLTIRHSANGKECMIWRKHWTQDFLR